MTDHVQIFAASALAPIKRYTLLRKIEIAELVTSGVVSRADVLAAHGITDAEFQEWVGLAARHDATVPKRERTPLAILRRHLDAAESDLRYHRARRDADGARQQGNTDCAVAGFKVAWLKSIIGEIERAA